MAVRSEAAAAGSRAAKEVQLQIPREALQSQRPGRASHRGSSISTMPGDFLISRTVYSSVPQARDMVLVIPNDRKSERFADKSLTLTIGRIVVSTLPDWKVLPLLSESTFPLPQPIRTRSAI